MDTIHEIIDSLDTSIATIQRLAELAPALDNGGEVYFRNALELLYLIAQQAAHLERLSTQLTMVLLPRPRAVGHVD